ncbi:hypothetical protein EVAR_89345_1 [Eumeta japonica]|uniref:Uncharacterized protein n=1 Tax=Eumeta variegata TaxID=151549 RepID=A0A4C1Y0Q9_EUMVA|nr:hypothetical protein EVAR_89345_1 [Eumeta japonica]
MVLATMSLVWLAHLDDMMRVRAAVVIRLGTCGFRHLRLYCRRRIDFIGGAPSFSVTAFRPPLYHVHTSLFPAPPLGSIRRGILLGGERARVPQFSCLPHENPVSVSQSTAQAAESLLRQMVTDEQFHLEGLADPANPPTTSTATKAPSGVSVCFGISI